VLDALHRPTAALGQVLRRRGSHLCSSFSWLSSRRVLIA
jgi:hypothetical protein